MSALSLGNTSMPSLLRRLERGELTSAPYHFHGHLSHIPRMRRTALLQGHAGCVNRLAFSEDANTLISASDDCTLRLWDVPTLTPRTVLAPGHFSNVFGVAFMPGTSDSYVASAGLDSQVRHTNVHTAASTLWSCHQRMVKTVTAVTPHVFISASKDGTARQFDVRVPPYHTKYRASNIIVRITGRLSRARGLNCAVISPMSENHLLVSASEPCVRIFDRRKCGSFVLRPTNDDEESLHPTSIGDCVNKLTPPHMLDSAPETGTRCGLRKRTYATFATYSPDAKQVVASFYDDIVHIFDLPNQHQPVACRSPFMSRAQHRHVIFQFIQNAVLHVATLQHSAALGCANRVLDLQPDHILALVLRAESLIRRNSFGDLRSSFATLSRVCKLILQDNSRIAELFGTHTPDGELCLRPDIPACAEKAEIWLQVFHYKQASVLFRLTPPQQIRMMQPGTPASNLAEKRLEHLDVLTSQIAKFVETKLHPTSKDIAQDKALGNASQRTFLFGCKASKQRGDVLQRLFDGFYRGLPSLRLEIQRCMASLREHVSGDELEFPCESDDTCSTDSWDDSSEDKLEEMGDLEKLQKDLFNPSDVESSSLFGPPPAAQQRWRSFYGHCSTLTDIKEARFYGNQSQVVLSGSDDGYVYMWATKTGELLRRVPGDEQIVNCVLPHPRHSMIISSGIDNDIKVMTPQGGP